MGWKAAQQQKPKPVVSQSFQAPIKPQLMASSLQDCDPFDFNPIPLKFNEDDDLHPFPAHFGSSSSKNGLGPLDVSTNTHVSRAPDQVQVSFNMVVNTPQGFRKETAVNTVTNIQIGTGTGTMIDERNKSFNDSFSNPYTDAFPGSNFQLTTDTPNGFIQISTQSNTQGADAIESGGLSASHKGQMNDFQTGFFGGFDDFGMGITDAACSDAVNNEYQGNIKSNTMNVQAWSGSVKSSTGAGADGQNDGLELNKSKMGNSVPCAASLVGSLFDDW